MSSTPVPPPSASHRNTRAWPWLLLVTALLAAGLFGWRQWRLDSAREQAAVADAGLRLDALDERFDAMRRGQRAQTQRLQQADATNRLLRDELLGIGQRAVLLEETVSKLADPDRHGAQALRLDETELLLAMAERRLWIAGDLDGARRAYALAAGVLAGVDDPAYLSLRQTLQQERASLEALGVEPRVQAMAKLDALAGSLIAPPPRAAGVQADRQPWWRRAFSGVVAVQPTGGHVVAQPGERAAAQVGLQLEISLARAAAERRDVASYRAAITRASTWLTHLWSPSPGLQQRRAQLATLAAMPLSPSLPTRGTTLAQLRQMRAAPN